MREVVLGIGSNIEREKNVRFCLARLRTAFAGLRISPIYETGAVGFTGPAFFNLVAVIESDLPLDAVLVMLHAIEAEAGRVRGEKMSASRTLDIDVLLFGDEDLRDQGRNIPRDEIAHAAYVLKPLADLLPHGRCALLSDSFAAAWAQMRAQQGDDLRPVTLDFSPAN